MIRFRPRTRVEFSLRETEIVKSFFLISRARVRLSFPLVANVQGVRWIVMSDVTLIGSSQLDAFRTAMGQYRMVRQDTPPPPRR